MCRHPTASSHATHTQHTQPPFASKPIPRRTLRTKRSAISIRHGTTHGCAHPTHGCTSHSTASAARGRRALSRQSAAATSSAVSSDHSWRRGTPSCLYHRASTRASRGRQNGTRSLQRGMHLMILCHRPIVAHINEALPPSRGARFPQGILRFSDSGLSYELDLNAAGRWSGRSGSTDTDAD